MKQTGLNACVYDFNIDYDDIVVDDMLDFYHEKSCYKNKIFVFNKNMFIRAIGFIGLNRYKAMKLVSMRNYPY